MSLILGGAIGNVIDSTFYGVFLNNAPIEAPTKWFHGQVIDMLYFPLFDFYWPDWVPFKGGYYFEFFSPVFNIADSSIFIGVVTILFLRKIISREMPVAEPIEMKEAARNFYIGDRSANYRFGRCNSAPGYTIPSRFGRVIFYKLIAMVFMPWGCVSQRILRSFVRS
ncbi:MAG: signal peptidase II [Cytophagales bacterium]|nr:signal peptidase II [Cytophagales bacterium]